MKPIAIIFLLVGIVSAVKRDENNFSAQNLGAASGTVPVYQHQPATTNRNGDHQASASSNNYQALSPSGGNGDSTSYYYQYLYPDNKKTSATGAGGYEAAASNNFASVAANQGNAAHSGMDQTGAASDLSYGQDVNNYNGASLGSALNGGHYDGNGGSGYEGQGISLSNLAQQYGLTGGANGASFQPAANGGAYNGPAYPTGNSYEAAASQNYPGSAGAPEGYGQGGGQPSFGAGGQAMYVPQANAFPNYGGQHFGNFASGSQQSPSYEPPATGLRKYGLGSIIMPMLALAGLSLLIPTVTSLTGLSASSSSASSRRKRSTDNGVDAGIGGYIDRLDRYYTLYKSAVENEECMNRIICQLGDAVKDVRGKNTFFTVLEKVAPTWMGNKVGIFKKGALSMEYEKCKQYNCN